MVLLDCGEKGSLGDMYLLALARGLEEALVARGYGPVINASRETLQRLVVAKGVDGVVLAFGAERWRLARELAEGGTACVVVAQAPIEEIPGVGCIQLDLDNGAREAARTLLDHGHRRIGFIANFDDDVVRAHFAAELKDAGVPLQSDLTVVAGTGREAGASAMRRLLSLRETPTAIFARTDMLAAGALQAAKELGIRVPEDLSIIGHDDIPIAATLALSSVRIDFAEMGLAVAEVLANLLQKRSAPTVPYVVRTQVIFRKTVSRPPSKDRFRQLPLPRIL